MRAGYLFVLSGGGGVHGPRPRRCFTLFTKTNTLHERRGGQGAETPREVIMSFFSGVYGSIGAKIDPRKFGWGTRFI